MIASFDIETIPDPAAQALMPEPEVKLGNTKDPEKIAAKVAEAKAAQAEKAALDPLTARVVCAGFSGEDIRECVCAMAFDSEARMADEERSVIQWIFMRLARPDLHLVTFNGHVFDLPMLYRRALILGIDPAQFNAPPIMAWNRGRYTTERHTDLKQVWTDGKGVAYQGESSLNSIARIVLRRSKVDFDVTTIPALIATDEGREAVRQYCLVDCDLTMDLFDRFTGTLIL